MFTGGANEGDADNDKLEDCTNYEVESYGSQSSDLQSKASKLHTCTNFTTSSHDT